MTTLELLAALLATGAGLSFCVDYMAGGRWTPLVAASAAGIAALMLLVLATVAFGWPARLVLDAMSLLAAAMFPPWQVHMRRLRRLRQQGPALTRLAPLEE